MTRILALIMVLIMCFSLAACGKKGSTPSADATPSGEATPDAADTGSPDDSASGTESDLSYILDKGEMLIGYTVYEPMNYTDEEGNFTGFDTEFAIAVCEKLGVTPEFVEIVWETKEIELNTYSIDCIWNGMTITADRAANMSISLPYVKNAQVVVIKEGSDVKTTADLIGKTVVAEIGSAGEAQIIGDDADSNLAQANYVGLTKQTDCLLEVKAGTADAAVLDWTLAMSTIGEGTDFPDLKMVEGLELAAEEYGIAFRKGSDVTEKVNEIIMELVKDGTLPALAEKYGLSLAPAIAG
ncbi:MAG: transporter substrate-binding domain-containing protein [Oscillospiraceae bacterium]